MRGCYDYRDVLTTRADTDGAMRDHGAEESSLDSEEEAGRLNSIKILLSGERKTGKSTLRRILTGAKRSDAYKPSEGIEIGKMAKGCRQERDVSIWDFTYLDIHASMLSTLYSQTNIHIVLYRPTDRSTFLRAAQYLSRARQNTSSTHELLLLANAATGATAEVSEDEGEELARDHRSMFMQTDLHDTALEVFEHKIEELIAKLKF